MATQEHLRLQEIHDDASGWRRWGPYLSDRAWATVREDYSANGDAWGYLPHDLARSKAYRWGEDGIAGVCDRYQVLCFAPAFWNERDPILKERLFGLTPYEGNHGEDVKEYYFHLDNTPTHSYMKFLYKYPQAEFPYRRLIDENRARNGQGFEFELLDTGVFDENRYFDIFIEYAKATPDDLCIRIEAFNRGPEPAPLHVLPHLWFRNTWAWGCDAWKKPGPAEPHIRPLTLAPAPARARARPGSATSKVDGTVCLEADDEKCAYPPTIPTRYRLGRHVLIGPSGGQALFTDNETNAKRVYGNPVSRKPYVKDAFHRFLVDGEDCINKDKVGTKAALHYRYVIPAGGSVVLKLRLGPADAPGSLDEVDTVVKKRRAEADEFYDALHPVKASADEKLVQRQALSGLLWSKQNYLFDVHRWLAGDCALWAPPESRWDGRNQHWLHVNSLRVMSMPDKWEYPWFAAWDLAFHTAALALVDPAFAKDQLWILLFEQFQHPNGQIPAYEWEFSDLNPPVHAWAAWRVYNMDRIRSGKADRDFLERCFHKLLINFAWWINKVDREGNNLFEGGFLGLDNITVFDRSEKQADGTILEQADATGWMGMFCLNLMRIALELAKENSVYEGMATKFFQHYTYVAAAMKKMGGRDYTLWDEKDGFFYDVLRHPDGRFDQFRVRSLVGLIPLFAVERLEFDWIAPFKEFTGALNWFLKHRQDLVKDVVHTVTDGDHKAHVLTIVNDDQLQRMMQRLFDESEFLSPYGVRSLSKAHEQNPFWYCNKAVGYEPAEATSKIKGGNSNWRGPLWFPTSFLLIESLRKLGKAYGPAFAVPTPANQGQPRTFRELAGQICDRLIRIFTRDASGRRPVFGGSKKFQEDPHWRDCLLFYEYFHGDNGAGLGASHQTGWTALVASLIDEWRK
jgi:hypothetical protein